VSQTGLSGSTWQGSLNDLGRVVTYIQRSHAFGRLSLRNLDQLSVVHLYFRVGRLIQIVGHHGDAHTVLTGLRSWQRAVIRFDRGASAAVVAVDETHEQLLMEVLQHLQQRGLFTLPQIESSRARVIDGELIASSEAGQLIDHIEWRALVEGTRRVSLAVAHLVGANEAFTALQDIIDDCSASFPAFASLKISTSGYLYVTDRFHLDRMSRQDLIEGFAALIAICQHFCVPIIGEKESYKLMVQTLQELAPTLVDLGVFRVNNQFLFDE
jgi:hypothetical protein